jgi:predicted DNA-binding WGR domain protein
MLREPAEEVVRLPVNAREPTPQERPGMEWWNGLTEIWRARWLEVAGSARARGCLGSISAPMGRGFAVILIRRRDLDRHMARFYALGMQADLLAGWALVREWAHWAAREGAGGCLFRVGRGRSGGTELKAARRRKGYR